MTSIAPELGAAAFRKGTSPRLELQICSFKKCAVGSMILMQRRKHITEELI
jgi:hypothetical protein